METEHGLKAIETLYDGNRFRSRLEARWAVFFNTLGIPYEYEPEGFNLNGLCYLPDFWLPEQKIFFEVKGPFTDNKGEEKAVALATASFRMVYMFGEIPSFDASDCYTGEGTAYFPHNGVDYDYMWCRKKCCGKYGIEFNGRSIRIVCGCEKEKQEAAYILDHPDKGYTYDHPSIRLAYTAARHRRFEHGGK